MILFVSKCFVTAESVSFKKLDYRILADRLLVVFIILRASPRTYHGFQPLRAVPRTYHGLGPFAGSLPLVGPRREWHAGRHVGGRNVRLVLGQIRGTPWRVHLGSRRWIYQNFKNMLKIMYLATKWWWQALAHLWCDGGSEGPSTQNLPSLAGFLPSLHDTMGLLLSFYSYGMNFIHDPKGLLLSFYSYGMNFTIWGVSHVAPCGD